MPAPVWRHVDAPCRAGATSFRKGATCCAERCARALSVSRGGKFHRAAWSFIAPASGGRSSSVSRRALRQRTRRLGAKLRRRRIVRTSPLVPALLPRPTHSRRIP